MVTMADGLHLPIGQLLREWRGQRRRSQLELASVADISTRHLSSSRPGGQLRVRHLVLLLADRLDVPLRERNRLLLAAGFAPSYPESALDSAPMSVVPSALAPTA